MALIPADGCAASLDAWCVRCPTGAEAGCEPLFGPSAAPVGCSEADLVWPSWRARYCDWRALEADPRARFSLLHSQDLNLYECWDPAVRVRSIADLQKAFPRFDYECPHWMAQARDAAASPRDLMQHGVPPDYATETLDACVTSWRDTYCVACSPDPSGVCGSLFARSTAPEDCFDLASAERGGRAWAALCTYTTRFVERACLNLFDHCWAGAPASNPIGEPAVLRSFEQLVAAAPGFFDPARADRCAAQAAACLAGDPLPGFVRNPIIPTAPLPPPRSELVATPQCPRLAEVIANFGATMRGGGPAPLAAYFAVEDGVTIVRAPPREVVGADAGCATAVAHLLDQSCRLSAQTGWCGSDATFEACLIAVQGVIEDPKACGVCGDGVCSASDRTPIQDPSGASGMACPEDCRCGDGTCDPGRGETALVCPTDCPSACGDSLCTGTPIGTIDLETGQPIDRVVEHYEVCGACADVPGHPPGCSACPDDCCRAPCGDGVCEPAFGETRASCEQDCGLGSCGDHLCLGREDEIDCPVDCHLFGYDNCLQPACRTPSPDHPSPCFDPRQKCGDGVCMGCEMWTCATDCGRAPPVCVARDASCPVGACGDGACDGRAESRMTCPLDCADSPPTGGACGDGLCQISEDATSCAADCR